MPRDSAVANLFVGGSFCKNVSDERRALEWLVDLHKSGVSWSEAERRLREHMTQVEGWKEPYIKEQVAKARERMKPWLG